MKKIHTILIVSLLPFITYAQQAVGKIDNHGDWKKFASFTERTHDGKIIKNNVQYDLADGKITSYRILQNSEIEAEVDVKYLTGTTVEQETKIYDSGRGTIREIIYKNDFRYDDKKNLIDDGVFLYSKFVNGRPQIATSKDYNETKKQGLKKILTYDDAGRVKLSKATEESGSYKTITISTFKYDQCGNLIEKSDRISQQEIQTGKKRNSRPTVSSRPTITKENYEYEYNGCLWTKKYKVANDHKELLAERTYE